MNMKLIEKNRHTLLIVKNNELPIYKKIINAYIAKYGGEVVKENSRFVHIEIYFDLLNGK